MFVHSSEMLALSPAGHQSFCASLNTPIVDIAELPSGSARAGILIHREPDRPIGLAIGLRAIESGQIALFRYQGSLGGEGDLARAVEHAIAFVEALGFLFDGETVVERLRKADPKALKRWTALMGAASAPETDPPSLLGEGDLMPPPASVSPEVDPAAEGRADAVGLSKFREDSAGASSRTAEEDALRSGEVDESSGGESGSRSLGRIPIVKRRLNSDSAGRGWVIRLLGSF